MAERDYGVLRKGSGITTTARGTWKERAFQDVIDFREGPGILAKDFREHGIPLVRLAGLNKGASLLEGCNYLDPEAVSTRWSHFRLELGDILLSTSASLGRIAVVGQEGIGAVPYTGIIRMRPRGDHLYAPFIRYLLEGPDFQLQAEMVGVGSVIRHFGPMHLRQMTVRFPPLPEQRAIARVLGALDDKIDLNRRMNETLEEMARALFKSWFVDFDPVRAKMEGRWRRGKSLPGLPADLYDLFPDRLVKSELGEVPEGWGVGTVSELAKRIQNGGTPKRSEPTYWNAADIPWLTSGEVRQSFVLDTQNYISRLGLENSSAKIIPARSILVALYGATAGQVSMNIYPLATNQAVSAIIPSEGNRYFCLVNLKLQVSELGDRAVGSAQQNISKKAVESTTIVLPPIELRLKFDNMVEGIFERTFRNLDESRALTAQRDALLPRLVSGEVSVPPS